MADEPDQDAGEFVLGTLSAEERRAFLGRLAREPALAGEVLEWQQRLAPLALALGDVPPPTELWPRIERSIGGQAANDNRAGPWRAAALVASLVALVLAAVVTQRSLVPPPVPVPAPAPIVAQSGPAMLAALSPGGETPGLFIRYDRTGDRVTLIPIGLTPDQAHSLEVWLIKGKAAPKPMWLLDPRQPMEKHDARGQVSADVVFAVSREPVGGSPTGKPTGPILMTGALKEMPLS